MKFACVTFLAAMALADSTSAHRRPKHMRTLAAEVAGEMSMPKSMFSPTSMSMNIDGSVQYIAGGEVQEKSEAYLVSMGKPCPSGGCSPHDCSGVLIARRVLLVQAACHLDFGSDGNSVKVGGQADFNREDIRFGADERGIVRYIFGEEDVVFHPSFELVRPESPGDWPFAGTNIALVILSEPAPPSAKTVRLNPRDDIPAAGDVSKVTGWGSFLQESEGLPNTLTVTSITNEECAAEVERLDNPEPVFRPTITDGMMCATAELGKGTCFDDRGSPLIHDGTLGPEVVGIVERFLVSVAPGEPVRCGTEFPAIYTRISPLVDWIEHTVCDKTGEFCKKGSKAGKASGSSAKSSKMGKVSVE